MLKLRVVLILLSCSPTLGQTFEPNSTNCIETASLGLWSPRVTFDEEHFSGQWFVADGPLGGSCSSGGGYFPAGSTMQSGVPVDVRDLGTGSHFITAILKSKDSSQRPIRRVWNVQITDPGDVDGDGAVGFSDFIVLSREFGNETGRQRGDLDYSGFVAFGDFVILSQNYGGTSAASSVGSVPEPDSWILAVFLVPLLVRQQRQNRVP